MSRSHNTRRALHFSTSAVRVMNRSSISSTRSPSGKHPRRAGGRMACMLICQPMCGAQRCTAHLHAPRAQLHGPAVQQRGLDLDVDVDPDPRNVAVAIPRIPPTPFWRWRWCRQSPPPPPPRARAREAARAHLASRLRASRSATHVRPSARRVGMDDTPCIHPTSLQRAQCAGLLWWLEDPTTTRCCSSCLVPWIRPTPQKPAQLPARTPLRTRRGASCPLSWLQKPQSNPAMYPGK
jgi:hypothetical protein